MRRARLSDIDALDELTEICAPAGWTITDVYPGRLYGVVLQHAGA
jgi:hypothetical protein